MSRTLSGAQNTVRWPSLMWRNCLCKPNAKHAAAATTPPNATTMPALGMSRPSVLNTWCMPPRIEFFFKITAGLALPQGLQSRHAPWYFASKEHHPLAGEKRLSAVLQPVNSVSSYTNSTAHSAGGFQPLKQESPLSACLQTEYHSFMN